MFETLLSEYKLDPVYICSNWSRELLNLMVEKMGERFERSQGSSDGNQKVSEAQLIRDLNVKVK